MGLRNYLRKVCRGRAYFKSVCLLSVLRKEDKGGGMMERLTIDEVIEHCKRTTKKYENLNGINTLETADISLSFIKEYWEHRQVKEYLEELKRYRDLEEQGLLLRLPCKVGNTVWRIFLSDNYIMPCNVEEFVYSDSLYIIVREELFNTRRGLNINEIGKTVFLTKAEAEKKLKGIGGENEID